MKKLKAEYFTDPLCSWSWGNEPNFIKTKMEFGNQIEWKHRMGGLIEHFTEHISDPDYDQSGGDTSILAKHQEEVSIETEMPINTDFWFEATPTSTFLACIAVKAAGLQGFTMEDLFLRRVREALLTKKQNLNNKNSIINVANEVKGLNIKKFKSDLEGKTALNIFHEDWEATRSPVVEAKDTKVTEEKMLRYSFPTLMISDEDHFYKILDSSSNYEEYLKAIYELDPTIKQASPPTIEEFINANQRFSTKEISFVCEINKWDAESILNEMVECGILKKYQAGHFYMWENV